MKKTLLSMATVPLVIAGLSVSASAADKSGIDMKVSGQTVLYYNTAAKNGNTNQSLFGGVVGKDNTRANFGIQLNLNADLKNDFTFGSQINYLGTLGLEKTIVTGVMQSTNGGTAENNIADDIYLSKLYIAKKMANTTLKLGRQELPKSLSPFAFSEGWNVFKNTFDAMLLVNSDVPDTVLVGAYVANSNGNGFGHNMSSFVNLSVNNNPITGASGADITGAAYMITAQNKSVPMTTLTGSLYHLRGVVNDSANIAWLDAKVSSKELPMGLKFGLQGGKIMPAATGTTDTTAFGLKAGMVPTEGLNLCLAYTTVDDGTAHVQNSGGVKTPLYTQMIANQGFIKTDNNTIMLKGAYNTGAYGKVILQGTMTTDNSAAANDTTDLELVYKVKAGSVNFLAALINQTWSKKSSASTGAFDNQNIARVVARYNF